MRYFLSFLNMGLLRLVTLFLKPVSKFLQWRVRAKIERAPDPIFIIGAPRTGSTFLYQALTDSLDVLFIDNIACRFNRDLFFGLWLSEKVFRGKPHDCFTSRFGTTPGAHSPSECGEFWYRWLPRDQHFVDHNEIDRRIIEQIRNEVLGPSSYFGKPLLFKNLNAGQRLRLIVEAFPNARLIYIKRNEKDVVSSMLKVRHSIGVPRNKIWSIRPKNYEKIESLSEEEMCREQIRLLQKQIEQDIHLFPRGNVFCLHYEELTKSGIQNLCAWLEISPRRDTSLTQLMST